MIECFFDSEAQWRAEDIGMEDTLVNITHLQAEAARLDAARKAYAAQADAFEAKLVEAREQAKRTIHKSIVDRHNIGEAVSLPEKVYAKIELIPEEQYIAGRLKQTGVVPFGTTRYGKFAQNVTSVSPEQAFAAAEYMFGVLILAREGSIEVYS